MFFTFCSKTRTRILTGIIIGWLGEQVKILDVGTGGGDIALVFQNQGHKVTPMDVVYKSKNPGIKPVIYDGRHFPFQDNSFDVVLLLTVLHHTPNPDLIIKEAKRVAKKIIIIEDIFSNPLEKFIAKLGCSVGNLEFRGHPHSNKTDKEWKKTFENLKLKMLAVKYFSQFVYFFYFRHAAYCLERN